MVDPGGIVRRGLLFLDDGKKVYYSFSLRMAIQYLEAEGIVPQPSEVNPQFIVLGSTTVAPLRPNDGGYSMADSRGYQFLIDYKSKMEPYAFFSLTDLLSDRIPAAQVRNKAVLIGVFAESAKDFFYTPHSRGFYANQQVPGVVIHASLVSQLIGFGLEGRSPKKSLSEANEVLWILSWSIVGAPDRFLGKVYMENFFSRHSSYVPVVFGIVCCIIEKLLDPICSTNVDLVDFRFFL